MLALRADARRVRAAGRWLSAIMWVVVGMSLVFTCVNVTMFGISHGISQWIAWLLDPMASLALMAMLIGDSVLARHGVRVGIWSLIVKLLAGSATWAMNTWSSVAAHDAAGIVLHSLAPALVIALAEATPRFQLAFADVARGLDLAADTVEAQPAAAVPAAQAVTDHTEVREVALRRESAGIRGHGPHLGDPPSAAPDAAEYVSPPAAWAEAAHAPSGPDHLGGGRSGDANGASSSLLHRPSTPAVPGSLRAAEAATAATRTRPPQLPPVQSPTQGHVTDRALDSGGEGGLASEATSEGNDDALDGFPTGTDSPAPPQVVGRRTPASAEPATAQPASRAPQAHPHEDHVRNSADVSWGSPGEPRDESEGDPAPAGRASSGGSEPGASDPDSRPPQTPESRSAPSSKRPATSRRPAKGRPASGSRRGAAAQAPGRAPARTDEELRDALSGAIKDGSLPVSPSARAIRMALRVGPARARQLRDAHLPDAPARPGGDDSAA